MWFKNLSLYVLPGFTGVALNDALRAGKFEDGPDYMERNYGWIAPQPLCPDLYAYEVGGQFLIALKSTKRTVPGAVLRAETERRAEEYEKEHGHKPGKKMRRELKIDAETALLPKAFPVPKTTLAWIDTKTGILAVDTSSQKAADTLVSALIRSFEHALNMRPLRFVKLAGTVMTSWVAYGAPEDFTVDAKAVFSSRGGASTVTFDGQALDTVDVVRQTTAQRFVTSLAMTFDNAVMFTLKASGAIRAIKPIGICSEKAPRAEDLDAAERFDSDFVLMTGTLAELIGAIGQELGGIAEPQNEELDLSEVQDVDTTALPASSGAHGDDDPLYSEAARIVYTEQKASISLVQRHLRIGYNRAARLLELMETRGVVSAMNSTGNRTILGGPQA